MTGYFDLPQNDEPVENRLPLKVRYQTGVAEPKDLDLPKELQFVGRVREVNDLAPLITIFKKHPHIREAVVTALRDEGIRV